MKSKWLVKDGLCPACPLGQELPAVIGGKFCVYHTRPRRFQSAEPSKQPAKKATNRFVRAPQKII